MTIPDAGAAQAVKNKCISVDINIADFLNEYKELQLLSGDEQKSSLIELLKGRFQGSEELLEVTVGDKAARLDWHYTKNIPQAEVLNQQALQHIREKKFTEALQCWADAIEINPIDPDYHYNLGLAFIGAQKNDEGINCCLESLRICPVYFRSCFVLGSIYTKMRQYEKAQEFMRTGLLLNSGNVQAWVNLGALYSILRKFDEAIRCFDRAIERSPKEIKAYLGMGKIYHSKKDYENAERYYNVVVKLDPEGNFGKMARQLLASLDFTENIKPAADQQQPATPDQVAEEQIPEYVNTLYAEGYQHFIDGNYDKAIDAYQEYLKYNKNDADVWASLASSQARNGSLENAVDSISKALSYETENNAIFYKQAAIIYDHLERYAEAGDAARHAVELGKQDSIILTLIGKSFIYQDKWNEGLNYLEDAVKLNPNNLTARYHLGITLKKLGQNDKALENFEEIIWSKFKSPLKNKAREAMQEITG